MIERLRQLPFPRRSRAVRRVVSFAVFAGVLAFWVVVLRPQALGGPALYIVVRGSSMLPTYENGDLVVMQASTMYAAGDIVAYRVPAGDIGEGHVIVHRIAGRDDNGQFIVKGDNNSARDPWSPRTSDIAGRAWLTVRGVGRVVAFIHQPVIAGALGAAIVVTLILIRPSTPFGSVPRPARRRIRPVPLRRLRRGRLPRPPLPAGAWTEQGNSPVGD